ncbi:unnamed protein product [Meloidogyne enterolobii]|uniref:Uncharacterized protein n=1 Tax=Meloidogyne enterolobii TaxID=390850 RepID=A0ACB0ZUC6_MELEN
MTEPVPSSSKLGKKPKWYFADDELARLPSRMSMDSAAELKYRREAAEFIQEMAERLNHNIPQHRGQINQNCICIAMIHMHRFFTVHAFAFFNMYKEVAAACLFLASKSEECPRKLEHVVEVWFRLKFRKAEVQPPFNEAARKNGAQLLVYLEGILLQTIGFELHVDLPHPIIIINMKKFKQESQKLTECAYWFATDIIQLTNWCIRFNERTIACVCIYLACSWADYEIPQTDDCPWFNSIDPDMTVELLNKLTDEFTRVYKECKDCHARRFIQKSKNGPIMAKSIAQLPPPPSPPVLQIKKENGINNTTTTHKSQSSTTAATSSAAATTTKNHSIKSSPIC